MSGSATDTREHLPAVVTEPAATPAPAQQQPSVPPDDPDDRAVWEARAELERGQGGGNNAPQPATTPTPAPARQAPARPAGGQQQQPMVPAGLLADARRQARSLADENLYLKGALAARTQQPQPGGTPRPGAPTGQQQPTIAQLIQAEGAKIIEAAKKFDQGEMSLVEFKQIELTAEDAIANLRAQHLLTHVQATQPKGGDLGIMDQQVLDQHLEKMAAEHPWSAELNDQEIDWLSAVARDEFRGLGKPIKAGNASDTLRLRQRVAELADVFGPQWYPQRRAEVVPQQRQQPAPNGGQRTQTGNNRPAAGNTRENARLANVAANQPPSLNSAGHADTGEAAITGDKIANMTEDEILALPRQVRDRYLYGG